MITPDQIKNGTTCTSPVKGNSMSKSIWEKIESRTPLTQAEWDWLPKAWEQFAIKPKSTETFMRNEREIKNEIELLNRLEPIDPDSNTDDLLDVAMQELEQPGEWEQDAWSELTPEEQNVVKRVQVWLSGEIVPPPRRLFDKLATFPPVKPTVTSGPLLKDHHIRHLISGTIVFVLCVAADVGIIELKNRATKPVETGHRVVWATGEVSENYIPSAHPELSPGWVIQMGFMDNETLVWRVVTNLASVK